jgi:hypothetical protein
MMQEYSHTRETETYRHLPRLARVIASYYLRLKRKKATTPTESQYAGDLVANAVNGRWVQNAGVSRSMRESW